MFVYNRSSLQLGLYCWWATFQSDTSILHSDNIGHVIEKLSVAFCTEINRIIVVEFSNSQKCVCIFKCLFTLLEFLNFGCLGSFNTINTRRNICLFGKTYLSEWRRPLDHLCCSFWIWLNYYFSQNTSLDQSHLNIKTYFWFLCVVNLTSKKAKWRN